MTEQILGLGQNRNSEKLEPHTYIVARVDSNGDIEVQKQFHSLAEAHATAKVWAQEGAEIVRVYEERGYWRNVQQPSNAALYRRFDAIG